MDISKDEICSVDTSELPSSDSVSNTCLASPTIPVEKAVEINKVPDDNQVMLVQAEVVPGNVLETAVGDKGEVISSDAATGSQGVGNETQVSSGEITPPNEGNGNTGSLIGDSELEKEIQKNEMMPVKEDESSSSESERDEQGATILCVDKIAVKLDPPEEVEKKEAFTKSQSVVQCSDIGSDVEDDNASDVFSESSESSDEDQPSGSRTASRVEDRLKKRINIMKVKGELDIDDLPPLEELTITVPVEECEPVGQIHLIVDRIVVVEALAKTPALDLDSILFREKGSPLGPVFDLFGPVKSPYYAVRFNSFQDIQDKGIVVGETVYCAPQTSYTKYVFVNQLMLQKGSDASWQHNHEPPESKLDYSDDECEKRAKQSLAKLERLRATMAERRLSGPERKQPKMELAASKPEEEVMKESTYIPVDPERARLKQKFDELKRQRLFPQNPFRRPSPAWLNRNRERVIAHLSSRQYPSDHILANLTPDSSIHDLPGTIYLGIGLDYLEGNFTPLPDDAPMPPRRERDRRAAYDVDRFSHLSHPLHESPGFSSRITPVNVPSTNYRRNHFIDQIPSAASSNRPLFGSTQPAQRQSPWSDPAQPAQRQMPWPGQPAQRQMPWSGSAQPAQSSSSGPTFGVDSMFSRRIPPFNGTPPSHPAQTFGQPPAFPPFRFNRN